MGAEERGIEALSALIIKAKPTKNMISSQYR